MMSTSARTFSAEDVRPRSRDAASSITSSRPSSSTSAKSAGKRSVSQLLTGQASPRKEESVLWQTAIRRYYDELRRGGIPESSIDKDLGSIKSPQDLLEQVKDLEPADARASNAWLGSLRRLQPILLGLNDFVSATAWAFGVNGKVAAVLWGSIRLILNLARPVLPEILDMLEELRRSLPRHMRFEEELPMNQALEDALVDMYMEIIIFCARTITFFRNNPDIGASRNAWSRFNSSFHATVEKLRSHSRRVDEEGELIRMTREAKSAQTVDVLRKLHDVNLGSKKTVPCQMVPYGLNPKFYCRDTEIRALRAALDPQDDQEELKVFAICGLGGVGKTQLALHYANTSFAIFELVAWIPAETQIKITQALSTLAQRLGLPKAGENEDDSQAALKVRDWLNTSGRTFLLIFDNVDRAELLLQIWPAHTRGSILITTRSPAIAARRSNGIMRLEPFSIQNSLAALYAMTGYEGADSEDSAAAEEICSLLGGLPLAIAQISEVIRDRSSTFTQFLALYRRSSAKILAKAEIPLEYDHRLDTVWDLSLRRLPKDSSTLQKLITFFDPDGIEERFLTNTDVETSVDDLAFLTDEFDFGEAVSTLARSSLVQHLSVPRANAQRAFSVHRLVQKVVYSRLTTREIAWLHKTAVILLAGAFPNTWTLSGPKQGHGWNAWDTCSKVLPHVSHMIDLSKQHSLTPEDPWPFAELVFRTGTYLWEREQPTMSMSFLTYGLTLGIDRSSLQCNQAVRLLGHNALDLAQPHRALQAYKECLESRRKLVPLHDPTIANVLDSVACAYVELGSLTEAFDALAEATDIHNRNDPKRMGRTLFILAMAHLRASNAEESLTALQRCWELQGLTQEDVEKSTYPKHSGDLVLLSRIEALKGNREISMELVSKTITIRKDILGNKGPRVADSMYILAAMLKEDGNDAVAARMLRQIIDMGRGLLEMRAQVARAAWTLANILEQTEDAEEAKKFRREAKTIRDGIVGREGPDEESDAGYASLVAWLLV